MTSKGTVPCCVSTAPAWPSRGCFAAFEPPPMGHAVVSQIDPASFCVCTRYFTSALPRALLGSWAWVSASVLLKPNGAVADFLPHFFDCSALPWFIPALLSVVLYSALPHKELRFIFPALPLLNVAAAHGLDKLIGAAVGAARAARRTPARRWRSVWKALAAGLLVAGPLALNCSATAVLSAASSLNYPGGEASREAIS